MLATAELEPQNIDLQFGPNVRWSKFVTLASVIDAPSASETAAPTSGVRAMYARLAQSYDAEPTVPDRRGGVPGDLFPL